MSERKERLQRKADGVRLREVRAAVTVARERAAEVQREVDEQLFQWRCGPICWFPNLKEAALWLDDAAEEARA